MAALGSSFLDIAQTIPSTLQSAAASNRCDAVARIGLAATRAKAQTIAVGGVSAR